MESFIHVLWLLSYSYSYRNFIFHRLDTMDVGNVFRILLPDILCFIVATLTYVLIKKTSELCIESLLRCAFLFLKLVSHVIPSGCTTQNLGPLDIYFNIEFL